MQRIIFLIGLSVFLYPVVVHAYIGPGLGLGALGVIFGIFSSIFLAIMGIFWYPIKRLFRKIRKGSVANND